MRKVTVRFLAGVALLGGMCAPTHAADKVLAPRSKVFEKDIAAVYAAVVQVASADYNLKTSSDFAHSVAFFTGGRFSMVLSAICRSTASGGTEVTLSISPSEGNPQVFGLAGAESKVASHFWAELDGALSKNEAVSTSPRPVTTKGLSTAVDVTSNPVGADILVDGKFSGSTPSTLRLSSGEHMVTIQADGYKAWERKLTVADGGHLSLNAVLQK